MEQGLVHHDYPVDCPGSLAARPEPGDTAQANGEPERARILPHRPGAEDHPARKPGSLCIIIVNFRTADLVTGCLQSLAAEVERQPSWRVVVVENGSADGSAAAIHGAMARSGG
jgi:hypothetical protein